jgi:hypothetical protein
MRLTKRAANSPVGTAWVIAEALYGAATFGSHVSQLYKRLDACRHSGESEAVTQDRNRTDDRGLHYKHAVFALFVGMDGPGQRRL